MTRRRDTTDQVDEPVDPAVGTTDEAADGDVPRFDSEDGTVTPDTDETTDPDAGDDTEGPVVGPDEPTGPDVTYETMSLAGHDTEATSPTEVLDGGAAPYDFDAQAPVEQKAAAVWDAAMEAKQAAVNAELKMAEAGFSGAYIDPVGGGVVTNGGSPVTPVPDQQLDPKLQSSTVERGGDVGF
jgi:hypothetical protein